MLRGLICGDVHILGVFLGRLLGWFLGFTLIRTAALVATLRGSLGLWLRGSVLSLWLLLRRIGLRLVLLGRFCGRGVRHHLRRFLDGDELRVVFHLQRLLVFARLAGHGLVVHLRNADGLYLLRLSRFVEVRRLKERIALRQFHLVEVLGIEVLVVLIAERLADQLLVFRTNDDRYRLAVGLSYDGLVGEELTRILVGLLEVEESCETHLSHAPHFLDLNFKIAHEEVGEVEPRHLEEQFVLIERVGAIDKHEDEVDVAIGRELHLLDAVAIVEHDGPSRPDVA